MRRPATPHCQKARRSGHSSQAALSRAECRRQSACVSSDDPTPPTIPPTLAIVNARVWTNDPRRAWADALLVRDGRVLAVGSSAELRKRAGRDARIVDARGSVVRPTQRAGTLAIGSPASLEIVEGVASETPWTGGVVVLELVDGEVRREGDVPPR